MNTVVNTRAGEKQGKTGNERNPRDLYPDDEPNSFEIETEELDPRVQD